MIDPCLLAYSGFVDIVLHTQIHPTTGIVSTLAGAAGLPGFCDGCGESSRFRSPSGIALDQLGCLIVADEGNHCIRRVSGPGEGMEVAGMVEDLEGGAAVWAECSEGEWVKVA